MDGKRKFPYYSEVQSFNVKRQGVEGAAYAGREYVEPRVFEQPSLHVDNYGEERVRAIGFFKLRMLQGIIGGPDL